MHNSLTIDLSPETLSVIRAIIKDEFKAIRETETAERMLSIREVMEMKGVRSKDTIYSWISEGHLKAEKVHGRLKIKMSDLNEHLQKYQHGKK